MIQVYLLILMSSFLSIIPFTVCFLIGRLLTGVCCGSFVSICPIYNNEITPDEMTGKVGMLCQTAANFGFIFSFGFSFFLPTENYGDSILAYFWMFVFVFPGLVALYQLHFFYVQIKLDSPAWYLQQERKEDAIKALALIYTAEGISAGLEMLSPQGSSETTDNLIPKRKITYIEVICRRKYWKMLGISLVLSQTQQLCGVNIIVQYSTSIFSDIGGTVMVSRGLTFIIAIIQLIAGFAAIPLLRYYGRKTVLLGGQTMMILILGLLGLFSGYVDAGVYTPAILIYIFKLFLYYRWGLLIWFSFERSCK